MRRLSQGQLHAIDWSTGDATDADVTALTAVLSSVNTGCVLTDLNLSTNQAIEDRATLEQLVVSHSSLHNVNVDGTGLDEGAAQAVRAAARRNRLQPEVDAVANNSLGARLDWSSKYISDDDVGRLLRAMQSNSTLTEVLLQDNADVSDGIIDQVLAVIGPNADRQEGSCLSSVGSCGVLRVDLDHTGVDDAGRSRVARHIDLRRLSLQQINALDWSTGDVADVDVTALIAVLANDGCVLTDLNLSANLGVADGDPIVQLARTHGSLRAVNIDGTSVDGGGAASIAAALRARALQPEVDAVANNSLGARLDWSSKNISDDDVDRLIEALKSNSTVSDILLQGNAEVTDASIDRLAAVVGPNSDRQGGGCFASAGACGVVRVSLDNTAVTDAMKHGLARRIELRQVSLYDDQARNLDWSTGDTTDVDVALLVSVLRDSRCEVRNVDLHDNQGIADGAPLLDLARGDKVKTLNLTGTGVDGEIQQQIQDSIRSHRLRPFIDRLSSNDRTLTTLAWGTQDISDEDIAHLVRALPRNTRLKDIQLAGNARLSDTHMDTLTGAVGPATASGVNTVDLDNTEVSDDKKLRLKRQIDLRRVSKRDVGVDSVDWRSSQAVDVDVSTLVDMLAENSLVHTLDLRDNADITDAPLQRLIDLGERCVIQNVLIDDDNTGVTAAMRTALRDRKRAQRQGPDLARVASNDAGLTVLDWSKQNAGGADGQLTRLQSSAGEVTDHELGKLLDQLPRNSNLREIHLQGNALITDALVPRLGELVGPNGQRDGGSCLSSLGPCGVMRVDLDNTDVDDAKSSWIARQIDLRRLKLGQLHTLDWSTGDATDADVTALSAVLSSATNECVLTDVNLSANLGIEDGATLEQLVANHSSLHNVIVDGTGLDEGVARAVRAAARRNRLQPDIDRVTANQVDYRAVDWSSGDISDADVTRLLDAMPRNNHVTDIELQGSADVTDEIVVGLAAAVGPNADRRRGMCGVLRVNLDNTGVDDAAKHDIARQIDMRRLCVACHRVNSMRSIGPLAMPLTRT